MEKRVLWLFKSIRNALGMQRILHGDVSFDKTANPGYLDFMNEMYNHCCEGNTPLGDQRHAYSTTAFDCKQVAYY